MHLSSQGKTSVFSVPPFTARPSCMTQKNVLENGAGRLAYVLSNPCADSLQLNLQTNSRQMLTTYAMLIAFDYLLAKSPTASGFVQLTMMIWASFDNFSWLVSWKLLSRPARKALNVQSSPPSTLWLLSSQGGLTSWDWYLP